MTSRGAARLAWSIALPCLAVLGGGLVLFALDRKGIDSAGAVSNGLALVSAAVLSLLGGLVASRRPRNPIGWMLLVAAAALAIGLLAWLLAIHGLLAGASVRGWVRWPAWVYGWFQLIPLAMVALVFFVFPDGKLLGRRWRPMVWAVALSLALLQALDSLDPAPVELSSRVPRVPNPVAVHWLRGFNGSGNPLAVLWFLLPVIAVMSVAALVVRLRRARGRERQQVRWVVYAAVATMILMGVGAVLATVGQLSSTSQTAGSVGLSIDVGLGFGLVVPGVIAFAILKQRLYDIDRLINRTLVYGALTVVLGGLYAGLALGLGSLAGHTNSVVIAGSTLVVAALFRPLRRRFQAFIDRRFYRRRYDAARTLEGFSGLIRQDVYLDALRGHLVSVVQETMQPAGVSLWLRRPESRP